MEGLGGGKDVDKVNSQGAGREVDGSRLKSQWGQTGDHLTSPPALAGGVCTDWLLA